MTADPLAGGDNDKFELGIFPAQEEEGLGHISFIFEAVFFVLSAAGMGTPNVEQIQQLQLYDLLLLSKLLECPIKI